MLIAAIVVSADDNTLSNILFTWISLGILPMVIYNLHMIVFFFF
jgi:hypothetical protein